MARLRQQSAASPASQPSPTATVSQARATLRTAADALRNAFNGLARRLQPVRSLEQVGAGGAAAVAQGIGMEMGAISSLVASQAVNSQTSTVRSSAGALGLDLTSPSRVSAIYSTGAVGLDLTTVESSSRLNSDQALGLDLTTPTRVSQLNSSQALGLDLTTPGRVSQLGSSQTLGLDVTSLERASQLQSSAGLSLNLTAPESASSISSTAPVGGVTASYTPTVAFGKGTSVATLSGVFTGLNAAAGATKLSIDIRRDTSLNSSKNQSLQFRILDQNGTNLLDYKGNHKAGDKIYLGDDIGLFVSFSSGTLDNVDIGTADISRTTDVDPNKIFNAADPNQRPTFANGAKVVAGSFAINGTSITVNADDSINAVIGRINSSAAGVTAAFADNRLKLTTKGNSEDTIELTNDTSSFLTAMQLTAAVTVKGNLRDDQQVLAKTAQFGAVTNGSFTVNGVAISVNKDTDTFASVVTKINNAGAGVTASYDADEDKLVFTPDTPGSALVLEGDSTGFLAAAKVATGARGTRVNPDAAFNATGTDAPLFENGQSVVAGSFRINGTRINVAADDSVTSVLAKITASTAGVTASFDADTQRVSLRTNRAARSPLTVTDDTSGFLAAVKLDATAVPTFGAVGPDSPLNRHAALASVTAGTIIINGQSIAVNPEGDSLSGVVASIKRLRGVSADLDAATGRLRISAKGNGTGLEISDTSGLLGRLGIASGKFTGRPTTLKSVAKDTDRMEFDDPAAAAESVATALDVVNDAYDQLGRASNASEVFKYDAEDALTAAVGAIPGGNQLGLALELGDGGRPLEVNVGQLTTALSVDPHALDAFFSSEQNLSTALDELLERYDDTTAAVPDYPAAAGQDVRKPLLGDTLGIDFARTQANGQLQLLNSAMLNPVSSDTAARQAKSRRMDRPDKFGQAPIIEEFKRVYRLPSGPEQQTGPPAATAPRLTGLEPHNTYSASLVPAKYAAKSSGLGGEDASGPTLFGRLA